MCASLAILRERGNQIELSVCPLSNYLYHASLILQCLSHVLSVASVTSPLHLALIRKSVMFIINYLYQMSALPCSLQCCPPLWTLIQFVNISPSRLITLTLSIVLPTCCHLIRKGLDRRKCSIEKLLHYPSHSILSLHVPPNLPFPPWLSLPTAQLIVNSGEV